MESLASIRKAVLAEAQEKARDIISRAEKWDAKQGEKTQEEADQLYEKALFNHRERNKAARLKAMAEINNETNRMIAEAKIIWIDRVIAEAKKVLDETSPQEKIKSYINTIESDFCIQFLNSQRAEKVCVEVSKQDEILIPSIVKQVQIPVEIVVSDKPFKSGIILKIGKIEIDQTTDTFLEEKREELIKEINQILFNPSE